jgi:anti-anti-sigma factor
MNVEITPHGSVTLVEVQGRIVDGQPAEQLQRALKALVRAKKSDTILDLAEVEWFDSLAIGILVSHYVSVTQLGGRILLLKANHKIKTLMRIVRLYDRFGWADDLHDALAWFEKPKT